MIKRKKLDKKKKRKQNKKKKKKKKRERERKSESSLVVYVIAGENLALASIRLGPASPTLQRYGPVRYLAAALQGMT